MIHPEEYKLEQFVLGADLGEDERAMIDRHLEECAGCRADVDEFRRVYADARNELLSNVKIGQGRSAGLVKRMPEPLLQQPDDQLWIPPPQNAVTRFQRFVGRNAVSLGLSTIGIVIILLVAIMRDSKPVDSNPAYLSVDSGRHLFEVQNREDEILWTRFIEGDWSPSLKDQFGNDLALVVDLNGDGRKEIVTTLFSVVGPDSLRNCVQAFDAEGKLILNTRLGGPFLYKGESFSSVFTTRGLLVDNFGPNGEMEIIVGIAHRHSPYAVVRLNPKGEVLGEYWHYGHFFGIRSADFVGSGKKGVVLCGRNDEINAGVIAVLDPSKIVGKTQATISEGYASEKSEAELYYIRFPKTELDKLSNFKPRVACPVWESKDGYIFSYANPEGESFNYSIDYSFGKDFRLQSVLPTDSERRLEARLVAEGKLSHPLRAKYWKELQNRVYYWDGMTWGTYHLGVGSVRVSTK
jgi:hypothetical protein